jgi:hypothetical protein
VRCVMPNLMAGVSKSAADMPGERCTAHLTEEIVAAASFALPAYGAHPKVRQIMQSSFDEWSTTVSGNVPAQRNE